MFGSLNRIGMCAYCGTEAPFRYATLSLHVSPLGTAKGVPAYHCHAETQRPEPHLHPAEDAEEGLERELSDDSLSAEIVEKLIEHDDPEDRHRGCCNAHLIF